MNNAKLQTGKLSLGERINMWLSEPHGQTFKRGKWRFWFPMLFSFGLLNAILTALVFGTGGNLQTYLGAIMIAVGVLMAWLSIGMLHYSDSRDAKLARGVSGLDSVTLVFVLAHFCFLLWVQGHLTVLQSREAEYKESAKTYNENAAKVSSDNVRIAEEMRKTAAEVTKAERLRNDTAYQERRAAQSGNAPQPRGARKTEQSAAPAMSVSPIELEKPQKPEQSSADFLTYWDFWVRLANFGELALVAITLIYIRNRSAKINSEINASTATTDAATTTKPARKPRAVRQGSKPPVQKKPSKMKK